MTKHKISIKSTTNPAILKFESENFLTQHQSYEFNNSDEAKESPLAQELFYLPFVKKVYISGNFIAIERHNIVEWADVQNEVSEQIEAYLEKGGVVIKSEATNAKTKLPATVYAESTPNPSAMKFASNKILVNHIHEFTNIEEAKNSPMATELFRFPFVKSVFIDENYVSITKNHLSDWGDITTELREFIRNYIADDKPVIIEEEPLVLEKKTVALNRNLENLDDTSKEIIKILEEYVKPAVAVDGGNIEFQSYDPATKTVSVLLQGACSGCPSSTYTLKSGIENMLREMMKGRVETVEAING